MKIKKKEINSFKESMAYPWRLPPFELNTHVERETYQEAQTL